MYKTYYITFDDFEYDYYDIKILLTKAENKKDAIIKFKNRLRTFHYKNPIIKEYQIQELDKSEIVVID